MFSIYRLLQMSLVYRKTWCIILVCFWWRKMKVQITQVSVFIDNFHKSCYCVLLVMISWIYIIRIFCKVNSIWYFPFYSCEKVARIWITIHILSICKRNSQAQNCITESVSSRIITYHVSFNKAKPGDF